jgi:enolase-phosphatase E1
VLFPFARQRLRDFVLANESRLEVQTQLAAVRAEAGVADIDSVIAVLERWSDEDRKATPLKALQGMIWAGGYASGDLVAHLYDDALRALARWWARGLPVHVYSSGSIEAQRLYFEHTKAGDLRPMLAGHFDTTCGPKQAADSYRRIAAAIGMPAGDVTFFSDVAAELVAARDAGMGAVQVLREFQVPWDGSSIASFDELSY